MVREEKHSDGDRRSIALNSLKTMPLNDLARYSLILWGLNGCIISVSAVSEQSSFDIQWFSAFYNRLLELLCMFAGVRACV